MASDIGIRHIIDLANRSYNNNQYTFTDFLTTAEVADFYNSISEVPPCGFSMFGGYDGAERVVIRFGSVNDLGYEEEYPIVCLRIEPLAVKFSDELSHRDVLGSIMNLGMEREKLGDILIKDKKIWVMCLPAMAELIMRDLSRIKHTSVICCIEEVIPEALVPKYEEVQMQAASERIDGIVAKLCKLSRSAAATLFVDGKIAVNGRENRNHSYMLKEQDIISVRGYGKYRYIGISGHTRKDNLIVTVEKFV